MNIATANRQNQFICLAVVVITLAIYARTANFEFVNYDDAQYALTTGVRHGFTPQSIGWALVSTNDYNWLPLTRLSFILDYRLFGPRSGPRHIENALLHLLASLMVFWFLLEATGARWPSAFASLLFAVHPLHVESVAWIAERKDVLCAFFWFLTLWSWVRYTRNPSRRGYFSSLLFFCLGLMSKPMMVTLPIVMLLLDRWPLRRAFSTKLLLEKIPFAALAAGGAAITFLAQREGGAVKSLTLVTPALRIENAVATWAIYIGKTLWPTGLAVWYPYTAGIAWAATGCGALLVAVSILILRLRPQFGYLTLGWFWYLVTTLPVIGLIQVGMQARADRYMYIPMVGLAIPLSWGAADLIRKAPVAKLPVVAVALAGLGALTVCAWQQTGYWRNSVSLFTHAIEVTKGNYVAYQNLGSALIALPGQSNAALADFAMAAQIRPESADVHTSLCGGLWNSGRAQEALRECDIALKINPKSWSAHDNKGGAFAALGRSGEAIAEYRTAIEAAPSNAQPHSNLGAELFAANRLSEALIEDDAALNLDPDSAIAHYNKGGLLLKMGDAEAAVSEFEAALKIAPDYAQAHNILGATLLRVPGRFFEGIQQFEEAVRIDPNMASAHFNLARALSEAGRIDEALAHIRTAIRIRPDPKSAALLQQLEQQAQVPN